MPVQTPTGFQQATSNIPTTPQKYIMVQPSSCKELQVWVSKSRITKSSYHAQFSIMAGPHSLNLLLRSEMVISASTEARAKPKAKSKPKAVKDGSKNGATESTPTTIAGVEKALKSTLVRFLEFHKSHVELTDKMATDVDGYKFASDMSTEIATVQQQMEEVIGMNFNYFVCFLGSTIIEMFGSSSASLLHI